MSKRSMWVLRIEGNWNGRSSYCRAFSTEEEALRDLRGWVRQNWSMEMEDAPLPEDEDEMIEMYFESVDERYTITEAMVTSPPDLNEVEDAPSNAGREDGVKRLADLLQQDIFTDAPEYRDRVEEVRSLLARYLMQARYDFSSRELATVLAALRYWQDTTFENERESLMPHFEDGETPLDDNEIDDLCEKINCS